ncbi:hypothetical protein D3273_02130 [Lichenibacterium minor]|uniref:Uncharacterized protein n=1 Tax=Lichenibacterium minor TaxID=2316528 RepID=A0A4Q2UBP8_9HYPH|nr:hypothetical protein [Lichenibacterium minor]RYC34070.1 hypothetical protein D3273_02130 [Lichenibacterium minor]
MAQIPKPPTSEARRADADAQAASAARNAARTTAEASRGLADQLLRSGADARFDALSNPALHLTPADRRRLLSSLTGHEPARRIVPGGTASRWALIRSRLPYRVGAQAFAGAVVLTAVVGLLVARSHTPIGLVVSDSPQDLLVPFTLEDGRIAFDRLDAGRPYALVSQSDGGMVLRRWVAGVGYAEAHILTGYMHPKP